MATAEYIDEPYVNVHAGHLQVRLAMTAEDVDAAQALRYRIFYEEMAAKPTLEMARAKRDFDAFDDAFDHLLVIDKTREDPFNGVVGTYRLNRRSVAKQSGGFYTAGEYDLTPLNRFKGEIMELGRSCVDKDYRTGGTMALLWHGIAAYVFHHDIKLLFGCASLPGVDPDALALPLSFLYHNHLAPEGMCPRALPDLYQDMNRMAPDAIEPRAARDALPPLIKGYLRLGGYVGDGAVVDHQFNTTDVCVVVETDQVTEKYKQHYAAARRDPGVG